MSPTGEGLCDAGKENDEMLAWCDLRVVNLVALSASVLPNSRKEGRLGTRGMGLATLISPSVCIYRRTIKNYKSQNTHTHRERERWGEARG
jgi:hypothetical protein